MKRLLISTAAVALMSSVGFAADLPMLEEAPAMIAPTPIASNWSGFYIGVHGGYGWGNADLDDDFNFGDNEEDFFGDSDLEGPVLGGQLGINWQFSSFVLGVEGDASWSGIDDDEDTFSDDADDFGVNAEVDWLASVRGRAGLAFDRFMVYGTGGVAFAEFSTDLEDASGIFDDGDDDGETEVGWVAGGGVEFLVTDNVSLGAEYLHYSFDDIESPTFVATQGGQAFGGGGDGDIDVIRGRVNVKFGSLFGG
jgi:outer membrane immunogenic protein